MNKFILDIRLVGEKSLNITFLQWDRRFLSDDSQDEYDFVYFESLDKDFCIYSHDEGYIIDESQYALVVPDSNKMKSNYSILHTFKSDDERYNFLRSMYEHMEEWANTWDRFKNDQKPVHDIMIHNQYWVY